MKLRNYALVTAGYWAFTLTDGALRMLVLLHFHQLGFSPVSIALLFVLYELMGIITNLIGGWVGSRTGLNRTLIAGLGLQVIALGLLSAQQDSWATALSVIFVMSVQALSGVAKDLTKMSSKSAVKLVAGEGALFRWVAILTGSKNALKGAGFFIGAMLLSWLGFRTALWALAGLVAMALLAVLALLDEDIGKSKKEPPLRSVLAKSSAINRLSSARFFLFGARDLWFVVALPIFLTDKLDWSFGQVGTFMAAWVIGYGVIQSLAPQILNRGSGGSDPVGSAQTVGLLLVGVAAILTALIRLGVSPTISIIGGLIVFGVVFALNSSVHSFLILAYADDDGVAMDVGFYYSANAAGRLVGTLGSGALYVAGGLTASLIGSTLFLAIAWLLSLRLPAVSPTSTT